MKRSLLTLKKTIFAAFFISLATISAIAQELPADSLDSHLSEQEREKEEGLKVDEIILEHVMDSHTWHLTKSVVLPLPVIVYSSERGLALFSSAHFYEHHHHVDYDGYRLGGGHGKAEKIFLADSGKEVLDLSITKNVMMLLINAVVLIVVLFAASRSYRKNRGKAPRGAASFIEPVILFIKDGIAKPSIGPKYQKFVPYLLTLFFFILFGNLLGLLPGSGNLTGNIAVTLVLALLTFFIVNFSGNKSYWGHIFWTPGVPFVLRFIILPVEMIGVLTKPFSLTVRLFVAITAGHIVLLALLCLAFIFQSWFVGVGATIFVIIISMIELLVAGIQAYVFTLFTALYIGQAVQEHSHAHENAPEHAH